MRRLLDFRYRTAADIARARATVSSALAEEGIDGPIAADATLLLSELMSNALRHTPMPSPRVRVDVDDARLRIAVTDTGPLPPVPPPLDPRRVGGNGIRLVEAIATEWGTHVHDGMGKTVWCCLPRTATA